MSAKLQTCLVLRFAFSFYAISEHFNSYMVRESTHNGVNRISQAQQQRRELPDVTLTWDACKYKEQKLHQSYIHFVPYVSMS